MRENTDQKNKYNTEIQCTFLLARSQLVNPLSNVELTFHPHFVAKSWHFCMVGSLSRKCWKYSKELFLLKIYSGSFKSYQTVLLKNENRITKKMWATWKMLKNSWHSKWHKKNIENGGKWKTKSITNLITIKFFTFSFCNREYFARKHRLGKCS